VSPRLRSALPQAALALVALLLTAWFAVLWRHEQIGRDAADRIFETPGMSDAAWERSLDQLRRAELLNPGTEWTTLRATALLLRDERAAQRLAESVARREPDNLEAWDVIYQAARGRDERRADEALAQIRRLNPPVDR